MNVSQLVYNADTDRYMIDGDELHCGDCLDVLIYNGLTGKTEWIQTRMEYNEGWYLVGLLGYNIGGLFARR